MGTRIRTHVRQSVLTLLMAWMAGCGPTAYKIEPVSPDRTLKETTLIDEGGWAPAKIVLIDVDGLIVNGHRFALLGEGENPVSVFVENLDKAARDSSVRGVVVRINSPGGAVTASDVMYRELRYFKERTGGKRPIVAVMMDVAASGGYFVACASDEIVAYPTTVTGSIGVIMLAVNFADTMSKIGIEADAITSGKMKDAGSPFRKMKPEERELYQRLIDQYYARFVEVVVAGRPKLAEARVRELADGRVYSGQQALENGLVDRLGTLRDGLAAVKQRIGAERVRVVTYHRPLEYKPNIYAQQPSGPPQVNVNLLNLQLPRLLLGPEPQFLYLWSPGL